MYLSRIIIENYRSIEYVDIEFSRGKHVIVGKNNAGKSNIARALNLVLGEKSPTYATIDANDFFTENDRSKKTFWILCQLEGDDVDTELIKSCRGFWEGKVEKQPIIRDEESDKVKLDVEHIFFDPDIYFTSSSSSRTKKYYRNESDKENWAISRKKRPLYFIFYVRESDDEEAPYLKELRLVYYYKNSDGSRSWCVSWGISKQIRDAFLTSAVVESFRDTNKQLRINSYSWYGKLIKHIWEEKRNQSLHEASDEGEPGSGQSIEEAIRDCFVDIQTITDNVFVEVATDIQHKIDISFDNTKICFQFTTDNRADIHKAVQLYVDDGFKSHIKDKGSGIQSAIIINLFSYYCHRFHQNTSLLIIEEPELYLHPQGRRALSQKLEDFVSLRPDKENQVILTTHASEFISVGNNLNGITIVRKNSNKTVAKDYLFEELSTKELQTLLKNENSEMFFADKVILVEGAEKYLMPIIADIITNKKNVLDNRNISVIRANSKGEFHKYYDILEKCQINSFIFADRDYFFEGISNILSKFDNFSKSEKQDLLTFASDIQKNSVRGYKRNKEIKKRILKPDIAVDAKVLCESLEDLLREQTDHTIWKVVEVWDYLKLKVKKKDVEGYMKEKDIYDKFLSFCGSSTVSLEIAII